MSAAIQGAALLMQWADLDPAQEADAEAWCRGEHIPRMTEIPGVLGAAQYRAVKGGPGHLIMIELDDPGMLADGQFRDAAGTALSLTLIGRRHIRKAYRRIFPSRADPAADGATMPDCVMMGRMDIPSALEEEFNTWYNTAYIPDFLTVPGCLGARRFMAVDGAPRYLTVYHLESPAVQVSDAWFRARTRNPWSVRMAPHMQLDEGSPAIFQRSRP